MKTESQKMIDFKNPPRRILEEFCDACKHEFGDDYCKEERYRDEDRNRICDIYAQRVEMKI